jgi:hypothetical protein
MAAKKTGRPPKAHAPGETVVVSVQMPGELKMRLQERATRENRTLSGEAELILREALEPGGARWTREFGEIAGGYGQRVALTLFVLQSAPYHEPFRDGALRTLDDVRKAIDTLTGRRTIDENRKEGHP